MPPTYQDTSAFIRYSLFFRNYREFTDTRLLFIIYDTGCDQTDLVTFRYREMYDLLDRVSLDIGEFAFGHLLSINI